MIKGILLGLFCFILFLILHAAIFHCLKLRRRFAILNIIFFSLIPVYALFFFLLPQRFLSIMVLKPEVETSVTAFLSLVFNFCLGLGFYTFLWLGYCQFYFIIDRSISVRFMIEIEDAPNKALTFEELKKIYSPDYAYRHRLEQLVETKYLMFKDGKYINTRMGRAVAALFRFLKKFLQLGAGG